MSIFGLARVRPALRGPMVLLAALAMACVPRPAAGQVMGALSNGMSAAAAGRGGTLITEHGGPLDALMGNPAGLAGVQGRELEAGGTGVLAAGSFENAVDAHGRLTGSGGAAPFAAFAMPVDRGRVSLATGLTPEVLMRARWQYVDPPGTAGVSYGLQPDESEIVGLRTSVGAGWLLGRRWTVGATVGAVYNENTLRAPYIFQEQPVLAGLKVLLDLHTSGWGWNGSLGTAWQASSRVRVGAAWKSGTAIRSRGEATGSASALFTALGVGADPAFGYRAVVENHLPQTAGLGLAVRQGQRLTWAVDGGWLGWGSAFRQLPVRLSGGTNATINSLVGSGSLADEVTLHWHDQFVARAGVEAPVGEAWTVRGGYGWMSDPVPSSTLTPMTAAVMRNTLSTGVGWARAAWGADLAYQAQLPASESVGRSALLAGEYDGSRVRVWTQSVTVTVRRRFGGGAPVSDRGARRNRCGT